MKRVTLTFDNGPDPEVTPHVLDLLKERGIAAHFFVLGKHIATPEGRALAARTRDEGHLLGNHSYTHHTPLGEDARGDAVAKEIIATEALLAPLLPPGIKRFRPFGGGGKIGKHLLSPRALAHLQREAYSCVLWNSVPRDWIDQEGWASRALEECDASEHAVVVLHDVANACLAALPGFLDDLRARNFVFTTDIPTDCLPISGGELVTDVAAFVADS